MRTLTIHFDPEQLLSEFAQCNQITSTTVYNAKVTEFRSCGYTHIATFAVHDGVFVPDFDHWGSGNGIRILDHLFFFRQPVDQRLVQNAQAGLRGHDARYIGQHTSYQRHHPFQTNLFFAACTPRNLSAWLRLFGDGSQIFRERGPCALGHLPPV